MKWAKKEVKKMNEFDKKIEDINNKLIDQNISLEELVNLEKMIPSIIFNMREKTELEKIKSNGFILAQMVAKTMKWKHGEQDLCIYERKSSYYGYCDDCPAAEFCPHESKQWSK